MNARRVGSRKPSTAHQYARDWLRQKILNGHLPGGARLVQSDIAARLDISTTPVREALRDLATEGLVHFDAHRGAVVHRVDSSEMVEVYEIRRRLEPLVVELAIAVITEDEIAHARALHEQMVRENSPYRWVELNREFHGVFMDACGWPRLASIVRSLHATASPYVTLTMQFRPDFMKAGNEDHERMIDAFVRRDTDGAVALMAEHMNTTKLAVEAQLGPG